MRSRTAYAALRRDLPRQHLPVRLPRHGRRSRQRRGSTPHRGSNSNTVYVETKNPVGGVSGGIPFHLAVICPTAASATVAVVAANGLIFRGSPHTRSFSPARGQYTLLTNRPLSACVAVATRGSIDTAAPFHPATVEVVPGPTRDTVGIQVRLLLSFGGNLASESFHAALVC